MKTNRHLIPYAFYLSIVILVTVLAIYSSCITPFELPQTSRLCIINHASPETVKFATESDKLAFSTTHRIEYSEKPGKANMGQRNASTKTQTTISTKKQIVDVTTHYTRLDMPFASENIYGFIDSYGTLQIRIIENPTADSSMTVTKGRLVQQNNMISIQPSDTPDLFDPFQEDFGSITCEMFHGNLNPELSPVYGIQGLYYSNKFPDEPLFYMYGHYLNSNPAFYHCDSIGHFIRGSLPIVMR